ncbi:pectate lyase [Opitutaceae bacterium EW11]|nr:pectate lyase [Opitutaceae bacterium EW11]
MRPPSPLCAFAVALFAVASAPLALATGKPKHWPPDPFLPVTPERVAGLPEAERAAWVRYLEVSREYLAKLPPRDVPEPALNKPMDTPPAGGAHSRGLRLDARPAWYASHEAQQIADRVVQAQTPAGAWTKGNNYTKSGPAPAHSGANVWGGGTFDNDATTWELRMLALVNLAAKEPARGANWREAFLRGVNYMLAAQYPNGGFPQIFPLGGGYHDAITYNDEAMVQVLELLRDISAGKPEFAFVPAELKAKCGSAMDRGLHCILASQIKDASGSRTVWCQQHDAITLLPCAARNFEPIAACSDESGAIVRFLMSLPNPSPEVVQSVDAAVTWLDRTALRGVVWDRATGLVEKPGAREIWARFYELGTDKPIFGDRDRTIHYAVEEISSERRYGYAWFGSWPASVLEKHRAWSKRVKR